MSDRSQQEQDLRATSDALRNDAARLAELEDEKQSLDPADPRTDQLSAQVEELGAEIEDKSRAERELSTEIEEEDRPKRN